MSTTINWGAFFKGFKMDMTMSIPARGAMLLAWAADKSAGTIIPYNIMLKYIMGYDHTPRTSSEEVESLRRKISSMRPILQDKYKRDMRNVSGVGARATVDDLDVVKSSMPGNVRRVNSAHKALARNAELVRIDRLPSSGPDKQWRDWYSQSVSPAIKALRSDERIKGLLPPAPVKPVKKDDAE